MKKIYSMLSMCGLATILSLALAQSCYGAGLQTGHCGYSGGSGGNEFNDIASNFFSDSETTDGRISEIRVRAGEHIDAIQIVLEKTTRSGNKLTKELPWHGGNGGALAVFKLQPDEYITSIGGTFGDVIDYLAIKTNKGRTQSWGKQHNKKYYQYGFYAPTRIIGIYGRAGNYIDAIGVEYMNVLK